MKDKYNFLSDKEPSEKQLNELMKAVLVDVKLRSEIASEKFNLLQQFQIKEAQESFKKRKVFND